MKIQHRIQILQSFDDQNLFLFSLIVLAIITQMASADNWSVSMWYVTYFHLLDLLLDISCFTALSHWPLSTESMPTVNTMYACVQGGVTNSCDTWYCQFVLQYVTLDQTFSFYSDFIVNVRSGQYVLNALLFKFLQLSEVLLNRSRKIYTPVHYLLAVP